MDSRGVTGQKTTRQLQAGRKAGVYMRVVRNTLLRRAVERYRSVPEDVFVGHLSHDAIPGAPPLVCSELPKRMQNLRSKPLPLKVSYSGVLRSTAWHSAHLRRSNSTPMIRLTNLRWQTGSYSGCCTRCESNAIIAMSQRIRLRINLFSIFRNNLNVYH